MPPTTSSPFAIELHKLRTEVLNESLRKMHARTGISTSYLQKLEAGTSKPSVDTISKISETTGYDKGVLMAAALPAVQASRELARRSQCAAHLGALLMAIDGFESVQGHLPPGSESGPVPRPANEIAKNHNWISRILPHLDEQNRFQKIDFSRAADDPVHLALAEIPLAALHCPSAPAEFPAASHYAGCHHDTEAPIAADNHGVLFLDSRLRYDEITDGRAYTLFLGEKSSDADDGTWMSGGRATLRNTGLWGPTNRFSFEQRREARAASAHPELYVGGFVSPHTGGNFGFGDGRVQSISFDIDDRVFQQLGHRADGALVPWPLE